MSKVIVTGGCGYIGSHVARAFSELDHDSVLIIDREYREHTVKGIDGFFIDDFASEASLASIYDFNPDIIVHCAGTSLVGPSMANPAEYYENNISKTIKMLNFVKDFEKKPLIMFSSSASVYGTPDGGDIPIREDAKIQPISPYGNTKAITETILRDYAAAYGIESVVFRYFNAAGAMPGAFDLGQEPHATHIIARALEAAISGRAFTINGDDFDTPDGTCIRDYVHVWDIAMAHLRAKTFVDTAMHIDKTAESHVFNLGTGKGISNKEIVDYIVEKYGISFVNYGPRRFGDPATLVADPHDARIWLGWTPVNSALPHIINTAYKWYTRNNIHS